MRVKRGKYKTLFKRRSEGTPPQRTGDGPDIKIWLEHNYKKKQFRSGMAIFLGKPPPQKHQNSKMKEKYQQQKIWIELCKANTPRCGRMRVRLAAAAADRCGFKPDQKNVLGEIF